VREKAMNLTEVDKQYATEKILGECWHEGILLDAKKWKNIWRCSCGTGFTYLKDDMQVHCKINNRPFTTQADVMALYVAIFKAGKWRDFGVFAYEKWDEESSSNWFDAWLFCLSGEGYEERCKMVADFMKGVKG
jgi:hypothetical protein